MRPDKLELVKRCEPVRSRVPGLLADRIYPIDAPGISTSVSYRELHLAVKAVVAFRTAGHTYSVPFVPRLAEVLQNMAS